MSVDHKIMDDLLKGAEINAASVRYFSLGRHALAASLRALGIGSGQVVLFPEYICRDLLASVHEIGARPEFYPVGPDLTPSIPNSDWPQAAAVLAVNYFGFAQPLDQFREYSRRTGAVLIEDNAHGFLSRDENGTLLGCRGDIGIFSLRKTFPLVNGAALIVSNAENIDRIEPQHSFAIESGLSSIRIKTALRHTPLAGPLISASATRLARMVRQFRTGYEIPLPAENAEFIIPQPAAPYNSLFDDISKYDFELEVQRRRKLYDEFSTLLSDWDIFPVFQTLPNYTAPYGFPFRASATVARKIRKMAERRGLDAFCWPDLPDAIVGHAPEHYRNTWLLNFLW